jgi:hypothetical protein
VHVTDRSYLANDWMELRWSAWMPLMAAHPLALAQLPSDAGVYRVRRADRPDRLEWIGWAERGVRDVVERLSRQVHLPVEPYDDPNSPARLLWSMRRTLGIAFEVSGAALPASGEQGERHTRALRDQYQAAIERES